MVINACRTKECFGVRRLMYRCGREIKQEKHTGVLWMMFDCDLDCFNLSSKVVNLINEKASKKVGQGTSQLNPAMNRTCPAPASASACACGAIIDMIFQDRI